jgi:ribosomal protein S12 methylthiotransferase
MSEVKSHTVALVSLGCPKNLVDSEHLLGVLAAQGFTIVEEPEQAEVIIVNTCAFIQPAEEEAIEALLDMADLKQSGQCRALLCAGCLVQRRGSELAAALPEVDGFLGIGALGQAAELIERALAGERLVIAGDLNWSPLATTPRWRSGSEWLAYLRIADGCNHHCAFCTIPDIRGRYRSRPVPDLTAEFGRLMGEGVREVCLIAQDTSAYGRDLPEEPDIADLLYSLGEVAYEGWLRLLYLHPQHVTDRLWQAMRDVPAVVPYVDIPLQHASEAVLRRMGRRGSKQEYLGLVGNIRAWMPDAALRTTVITGFPGETDAEFEELLSFLEEAALDRVSVFRYWPEEGTRAAELPGQLPDEVRDERLAQVMLVQEMISLERNQALVGQVLKVLVEEKVEQVWKGRSTRDAPEVDGEVKILGAGDLCPGEFAKVRITRAEVHDLEGVVEPG